ncbi:MAG: type II toxin-antitoxin system RelE/ParE family toxin [Rhizomicrobium sp.]
MKAVLRKSAYADLKRIHDWIASDSPPNAQSVIGRILDAIEYKIPAFPFIGRKGTVEGTREWIVRGLPYIIVYRVSTDAIEVLAIYHGAQSR